MTLILPHLDLAKGISRDRENQRLEELYSMGVLDRSSDERFVRYTELAARSLQAPIAAVVLVDRDRLVFKAVHGRVSREVRRDASFAAPMPAASFAGAAASRSARSASWTLESAASRRPTPRSSPI
jgi:hypothetical protein